jgi:parvulin-like peptidyl-prolyl isomerase
MSSPFSRRAMALLAGASVTIVLLGGCGKRMAAKVNGQVISQEEFHERAINFNQNQILSPPVGLFVIEEIINDRLLEQEAQRLKLLPTDAEVNAELESLRKQVATGGGASLDARLKEVGLTVDNLKSGIRRQLIQRKLFTQGVTVADKEIQEFYDQNKQSQFTTPAQAKVRQVTVASPEAAKEVKRTLDKNADFALVARSKSIDQFKEAGGELPPLMRGFPNPNVSNEVMSAAFSAPVGKPTEPMKVGNNWVVLKVESRKPQETRTLAEAKEEIQQMLMMRKSQESGQMMKTQQRLIELRRDADIQIGIEQLRQPIMDRQQQLKQAPMPGITPELPGGATSP